MSFLRRLLCFHPYWVKTGAQTCVFGLVLGVARKRNFGCMGILINYVDREP